MFPSRTGSPQKGSHCFFLINYFRSNLRRPRHKSAAPGADGPKCSPTTLETAITASHEGLRP